MGVGMNMALIRFNQFGWKLGTRLFPCKDLAIRGGVYSPFCQCKGCNRMWVMMTPWRKVNWFITDRIARRAFEKMQSIQDGVGWTK